MTPRTAQPGQPRGRPAFTLMETLVVIVIVGILAGLMLPRMINVGRRQAEQESAALQRLLTVAAEKCAVWGQVVAVDCVTDGSGLTRLTVWSQVQDSKATLDTTGAARVYWREDPLVEPVALDRLRIAQAAADGQILPSGKWRVTMVRGMPRPEMTFRLEPKVDGDGPRWVISLAPDQTNAVREPEAGSSTASRAPAMTQSRSIDLDDTGKGQAPW